MDLTNTSLPPVYRRNGRECYLDPIRKKLIYITPEETVRQRVISCLLSTLHVPADMITVEEPLTHYGLKTKDRADIIILAMNEEDELSPITVIECKAESVYLDEKAFSQAQRYSDSLECEYTLLINGHESFCYRFDEESTQYIHAAAKNPF